MNDIPASPEGLQRVPDSGAGPTPVAFPSVAYLVAQIEDAGRSFAENELAFLALTSKVERPFLDRVAYRTFVSLSRSGYAVTREWRIARVGRADLVLLRDECPVMIVEAKAMVSFDCTREGLMQRQYADALQADLDRYADAQLPDTDIYCLLLSSCPLSSIPQHLARTLKYAGPINAAFKKFATPDDISVVAEANLFNFVRRETVVGSGSLPGGSAYGVGIELRYWLFGPFRSPANLRILSDPAPSTALQVADARDLTKR